MPSKQFMDLLWEDDELAGTDDSMLATLNDPTVKVDGRKFNKGKRKLPEEQVKSTVRMSQHMARTLDALKPPKMSRADYIRSIIDEKLSEHAQTTA